MKASCWLGGLLLFLAWSLLSDGFASAQKLLLCDYCNGRGYLAEEPNPYYCYCRCNTANADPVDPTYPYIRSFNLTSAPTMRLLPPTCRYLAAESLTAQFVLGTSAAATDGGSLIAALAAYLRVSRSDQLVFLRLEDVPSTSASTGAGSAQCTFTFDIRVEATLMNVTISEEALAIGPRALLVKLKDALTATPTPTWVSDFRVSSVREVALSAGPTHQVSLVVTTIRGYPLYMEPLLFFSVAFLMALLFPLVEASLTTRERSDATPARSQSVAPVVHVAAPAYAVDVGKVGPDDNVDEEQMEGLPRQASQARRKSITSDGGDYDGGQRGIFEVPEYGHEQSPPFERKKSRASSFYFTGE